MKPRRMSDHDDVEPLLDPDCENTKHGNVFVMSKHRILYRWATLWLSCLGIFLGSGLGYYVSATIPGSLKADSYESGFTTEFGTLIV